MASTIKVDQIEGSSGSTITVPTGQTFTITDGLAASTIGSGTLDVARLPTVTVAKGGTNLSSFTAGDLLYATGSTTLAKLAKGTSAQTLKMNSGATAPEWATVAASASNVVTYTNSTNSFFTTTTTGSWVDVTGLTATITPTTSSKKILVMLDCSGSARGAQYYQTWQYKLLRNIDGGSYTTPAQFTDNATSSTNVGASMQTKRGVFDGNAETTGLIMGVDAPATTDAVNYKFQVWQSGNTFAANSTFTNSGFPGGQTRLTLMEI